MRDVNSILAYAKQMQKKAKEALLRKTMRKEVNVGANGTHKIIPKTGDFLLFHAGLKHTVYPFKSDVTRTSMSFNVMGME